MQLEHVVRMPSGESKPVPVLLLHGAWHGAWCYDLWLDAFAAWGYETHAMSLPAHGNSGRVKPLNLYSIGDYAKALGQVIDEITPRPFVIGHSMGGFVLQHYLKTHRLPGAVLLASVPSFGMFPMSLRMLYRNPLPVLRGLLTLNPYHWLGTPTLVSRYLITEGAAYSAEEIVNRLGSESLRVGFELSLWLRGKPELVKDTPLLVVAAESDGSFPLREQKHTAKAYNANFMLIEGRGHNLMMESDWQQTARRIGDWLDRLESVSR